MGEVARVAANKAMDALSGTTTSATQTMSYGWLLKGCTLNIEVGVGNGHTAQLQVDVGGQKWGPSRDHLLLDAGATDPLIGEILRIKADVSAGSLSPTPLPPPLVTVTLYQLSSQSPGQPLLPETIPVTGVFGTGNLCVLDFGILLK